VIRILHVGHCGAYKNVEALLCALPRVEKLLATPVRLTKVGGDFTESQKQLIVGLDLAGRIDHLHDVGDLNLPAVYASADALLMPSLDEGFGLPAIEAMAMGTPVIAADRGALPDVVGDVGVLVDPSDEGMLARVVAQTLSNAPLLMEMSRRGRERALSFTWAHTARATLDVYREIQAEAAGARWRTATL
jgi:glycosyltransferase involved in cell wall biosynthesis